MKQNVWPICPLEYLMQFIKTKYISSSLYYVCFTYRKKIYKRKKRSEACNILLCEPYESYIHKRNIESNPTSPARKRQILNLCRQVYNTNKSNNNEAQNINNKEDHSRRNGRPKQTNKQASKQANKLRRRVARCICWSFGRF